MRNPFTLEECQEWLKERSIHPRTRKTMTSKSRAYATLEKACVNFKLIDPPKKKCQLWAPVNDKTAGIYGIEASIPCSCRGHANAYAVHNPNSLEFECIECGEDVDIRYMCKSCKLHQVRNAKRYV